jgi:molybdopterin-guanine dinucleotide biosynthesis protein A
MRVRTRPIGAILAGGDGRRIGGDKAIVELQGKPLISYPLEAVREALGQVAILAKADTKLPYVSGVTVWIEPDERRHPIVGITQALALADGRPALVCGADLPFVSAELISDTIAAMEPVLLEVDDPDELFDVNSPDDLLQAAAMLDRRRLHAPY